MHEQLEGVGEKLWCPGEAVTKAMTTVTWSLPCARYFPKYFIEINLQSYLVLLFPIYRWKN